MPKNYYIILGIPVDSSQADIKTAFRKLAKEYHPDRYGANQAPFRLIQEAYSVLSDPQQRRSYDRSRIGSSPKREVKEASWFNPSPPHHTEPLTAGANITVEGMTAVDRSIHAYNALFDGLFDRMLGNFSENDELVGEQNRTIEIRLTPEQARAGGNMRVLVPFQISCPNCSRSSSLDNSGCWRCNGSSVLRGEKQIMISYPPGVSDNHTIILPATRVAGQELQLAAICKIVPGR